MAEYGVVKLGVSNRELSEGNLELCRSDFKELLSLTQPPTDNNVDQIVSFYRKNGQDHLKFRNYVGVLRVNSDLQIEVLPKISKYHNDIGEMRSLLVSMLKTLRNSPFKQLDNASLDVHRMTIFELLISTFLAEVLGIAKRGIARAYISTRGEQNFVRGKLLVTAGGKRNIANQAVTLCEYDEFSDNRPVNRLVVSALKLVSRLSSDSKNIRTCKQLLQVFSAVPESNSWRKDLQAIKLDRSATHYKAAVKLSQLILESLNPLTQHGSNELFALLYPMERVFEDYVAKMLSINYPELNLVTQETSRHMVYSIGDSGRKAFNIRPDIVIRAENSVFIADTKWKLLNNDFRQGKISRSDVYQMYAYINKYFQDNRVAVVLIYPKTAHFNEPFPTHWFDKNKTQPLHILPFDLKTGILVGGDILRSVI